MKQAAVRIGAKRSSIAAFRRQPGTSRQYTVYTFFSPTRTQQQRGPGSGDGRDCWERRGKNTTKQQQQNDKGKEEKNNSRTIIEIAKRTLLRREICPSDSAVRVTGTEPAVVSACQPPRPARPPRPPSL